MLARYTATPDVSTVTLPTPDVSTGTLSTTNVSTGTLHITNVSTVTLPSPDVSKGTLTAPDVSTVTLPIPDVSTVTLPAPDVSTVTLPTPDVSTGTLPNTNVSTGTLPSTRTNVSTGTLPTPAPNPLNTMLRFKCFFFVYFSWPFILSLTSFLLFSFSISLSHIPYTKVTLHPTTSQPLTHSDHTGTVQYSSTLSLNSTPDANGRLKQRPGTLRIVGWVGP
jgi:hypothetical protein